ncbi:hypothetical protein CKA27_01505 [Vibrio coralliilyticus]|nr:hypothetical protein CKA27_01505 [Vibrio coralliilyticus]
MDSYIREWGVNSFQDKDIFRYALWGGFELIIGITKCEVNFLIGTDIFMKHLVRESGIIAANNKAQD